MTDTARAGSRVNDKAISREAQRLWSRLVDVKVFLEGVDKGLLEDLLHRQQCRPEADGMPPSSSGTSPGGSTRGEAEDWTPTERAALNDHVPHDPVGVAIETALFDLDEGTLGILKAQRLVNVVLHTADAYRGRPVRGGTCLNCGDPVGGTTPNDRLIRGLDKKCYSRWYDLAIPRPNVRDWALAEQKRRKDAEAEAKAKDRLAEALSSGVAEGLRSEDEETAEIERLRANGELPAERVRS